MLKMIRIPIRRLSKPPPTFSQKSVSNSGVILQLLSCHQPSRVIRLLEENPELEIPSQFVSNFLKSLTKTINSPYKNKLFSLLSSKAFIATVYRLETQIRHSSSAEEMLNYFFFVGNYQKMSRCVGYFMYHDFFTKKNFHDLMGFLRRGAYPLSSLVHIAEAINNISIFSMSLVEVLEKLEDELAALKTLPPSVNVNSLMKLLNFNKVLPVVGRILARVAPLILRNPEHILFPLKGYVDICELSSVFENETKKVKNLYEKLIEQSISAEPLNVSNNLGLIEVLRHRPLGASTPLVNRLYRDCFIPFVRSDFQRENYYTQLPGHVMVVMSAVAGGYLLRDSVDNVMDLLEESLRKTSGQIQISSNFAYFSSEFCQLIESKSLPSSSLQRALSLARQLANRDIDCAIQLPFVALLGRDFGAEALGRCRKGSTRSVVAYRYFSRVFGVHNADFEALAPADESREFYNFQEKLFPSPPAEAAPRFSFKATAKSNYFAALAFFRRSPPRISHVLAAILTAPPPKDFIFFAQARNSYMPAKVFFLVAAAMALRAEQGNFLVRLLYFSMAIPQVARSLLVYRFSLYIFDFLRVCVGVIGSLLPPQRPKLDVLQLINSPFGEIFLEKFVLSNAAFPHSQRLLRQALAGNEGGTERYLSGRLSEYFVRVKRVDLLKIEGEVPIEASLVLYDRDKPYRDLYRSQLNSLAPKSPVRLIDPCMSSSEARDLIESLELGAGDHWVLYAAKALTFRAFLLGEKENLKRFVSAHAELVSGGRRFEFVSHLDCNRFDAETIEALAPAFLSTGMLKMECPGRVAQATRTLTRLGLFAPPPLVSPPANDFERLKLATAAFYAGHAPQPELRWGPEFALLETVAGLASSLPSAPQLTELCRSHIASEKATGPVEIDLSSLDPVLAKLTACKSPLPSRRYLFEIVESLRLFLSLLPPSTRLAAESVLPPASEKLNVRSVKRLSDDISNLGIATSPESLGPFPCLRLTESETFILPLSHELSVSPFTRTLLSTFIALTRPEEKWLYTVLESENELSDHKRLEDVGLFARPEESLPEFDEFKFESDEDCLLYYSFN